MLTDKDAVISAIEVLKEDSFYREDNKAIFRAITNLYSRNENYVNNEKLSNFNL